MRSTLCSCPAPALRQKCSWVEMGSVREAAPKKDLGSPQRKTSPVRALYDFQIASPLGFKLCLSASPFPQDLLGFFHRALEQFHRTALEACAGEGLAWM